MTINRARLVDLAVWAGGQHALAELGLPSEWNQARWLAERPGVRLAGWCGTAGCLAGRTALADGYMPTLDGSGYLDGFRVVDPGTGNDEPISQVARELLGLEACQAHVLFHEDNGFGDVLRIVSKLLNGGDVSDERNHPESYDVPCNCYTTEVQA